MADENEPPTANEPVTANEPPAGIVYEDGDLVWVKLGSCWWPGEVHDVKRVPPEIQPGLKKTPIAYVHFFGEDKYEYVKHVDQIYHYNCNRKKEFLQKGLDGFRKNRKFMEKFPEDVEKAETMIGGNPKILESDEFKPVPKVDYRSLFASPETKVKAVNKSSSPNKSMRRKTSVATISVEDYNRRMHISTDYEEHDLSNHENRPLNESLVGDESVVSIIYTCEKCDYSCTRLNVLVYHHKSHTDPYTNGYLSQGKVKKIRTKVYKKKNQMTKCGTSTIDEDLELISKGIDICSFINKKSQFPKLKLSKKMTFDKKKPAKKEVKITNILADWDDSDEEKQTENVEKTKETSCFDFEEDEEVATIISKSPGRKIPRVIPEKSPEPTPTTIKEPKKSGKKDNLDLEFDQIMAETTLPDLQPLTDIQPSTSKQADEKDAKLEKSRKRKSNAQGIIAEETKKGKKKAEILDKTTEASLESTESKFNTIIEKENKRGKKWQKIEAFLQTDPEIIQPEVEQNVTSKRGRRGKKSVIELIETDTDKTEEVLGEAIFHVTSEGSQLEEVPSISKVKKGKKKPIIEILSVEDVVNTTAETVEVESHNTRGKKLQKKVDELTGDSLTEIEQVLDEVEKVSRNRRSKKIDIEAIESADIEIIQTETIAAIPKGKRNTRKSDVISESIEQIEETITEPIDDETKIVESVGLRGRRNRKKIETTSQELLEILEEGTTTKSQKKKPIEPPADVLETETPVKESVETPRGLRTRRTIDNVQEALELDVEPVAQIELEPEVARSGRKTRGKKIETEIEESKIETPVENIELDTSRGQRSRKKIEKSLEIETEDIQGSVDQSVPVQTDELDSSTTKRSRKKVGKVELDQSKLEEVKDLTVDSEIPEISDKEPETNKGRRGRKKPDIEVPELIIDEHLEKGNEVAPDMSTPRGLRGRKKLEIVPEPLDPSKQEVIIEPEPIRGLRGRKKVETVTVAEPVKELEAHEQVQEKVVELNTSVTRGMRGRLSKKIETLSDTVEEVVPENVEQINTDDSNQVRNKKGKKKVETPKDQLTDTVLEPAIEHVEETENPESAVKSRKSARPKKGETQIVDILKENLSETTEEIVVEPEKLVEVVGSSSTPRGRRVGRHKRGETPVTDTPKETLSNTIEETVPESEKQIESGEEAGVHRGRRGGRDKKSDPSVAEIGKESLAHEETELEHLESVESIDDSVITRVRRGGRHRRAETPEELKETEKTIVQSSDLLESSSKSKSMVRNRKKSEKLTELNPEIIPEAPILEEKIDAPNDLKVLENTQDTKRTTRSSERLQTPEPNAKSSPKKSENSVTKVEETQMSPIILKTRSRKKPESEIVEKVSEIVESLPTEQPTVDLKRNKRNLPETSDETKRSKRFSEKATDNLNIVEEELKDLSHTEVKRSKRQSERKAQVVDDTKQDIPKETVVKVVENEQEEVVSELPESDPKRSRRNLVEKHQTETKESLEKIKVRGKKKDDIIDDDDKADEPFEIKRSRRQAQKLHNLKIDNEEVATTSAAAKELISEDPVETESDVSSKKKNKPEAEQILSPRSNRGKKPLDDNFLDIGEAIVEDPKQKTARNRKKDEALESTSVCPKPIESESVSKSRKHSKTEDIDKTDIDNETMSPTRGRSRRAKYQTESEDSIESPKYEPTSPIRSKKSSKSSLEVELEKVSEEKKVEEVELAVPEELFQIDKDETKKIEDDSKRGKKKDKEEVEHSSRVKRKSILSPTGFKKNDESDSSVSSNKTKTESDSLESGEKYDRKKKGEDNRRKSEYDDHVRSPKSRTDSIEKRKKKYDSESDDKKQKPVKIVIKSSEKRGKGESEDESKEDSNKRVKKLDESEKSSSSDKKRIVSQTDKPKKPEEIPKYLQKPPIKLKQSEPLKIDTPTRIIPYEGAFEKHFAELDAVITQQGRKGRKRPDGIISTKQPKLKFGEKSGMSPSTSKIDAIKKTEGLKLKTDETISFTKIDKFKRKSDIITQEKIAAKQDMTDTCEKPNMEESIVEKPKPFPAKLGTKVDDLPSEGTHKELKLYKSFYEDLNDSKNPTAESFHEKTIGLEALCEVATNVDHLQTEVHSRPIEPVEAIEDVSTKIFEQKHKRKYSETSIETVEETGDKKLKIDEINLSENFQLEEPSVSDEHSKELPKEPPKIDEVMVSEVAPVVDTDKEQTLEALFATEQEPITTTDNVQNLLTTEESVTHAVTENITQTQESIEQKQTEVIPRTESDTNLLEPSSFCKFDYLPKKTRKYRQEFKDLVDTDITNLMESKIGESVTKTTEKVENVVSIDISFENQPSSSLLKAGESLTDEILNIKKYKSRISPRNLDVNQVSLSLSMDYVEGPPAQKSPRKFLLSPREKSPQKLSPKSVDIDEKPKMEFSPGVRSPRKQVLSPKAFDIEDRSPRKQVLTPKVLDIADRSPRKQILSPKSFDIEDQSPRKQILSPKSFDTEDRSPRKQVLSPKSFDIEDKSPRKQVLSPKSFDIEDRSPHKQVLSPKLFDIEDKSSRKQVLSPKPFDIEDRSPRKQVLSPKSFEIEERSPRKQIFSPKSYDIDSPRHSALSPNKFDESESIETLLETEQTETETEDVQTEKKPSTISLSNFKIEDIPLPPSPPKIVPTISLGEEKSGLKSKTPIKFEKFKIKTPFSKKIILPKGFGGEDEEDSLSLVRKGQGFIPNKNVAMLKKNDSKECESPKKRVMADYKKEIDLENQKKQELTLIQNEEQSSGIETIEKSSTFADESPSPETYSQRKPLVDYEDELESIENEIEKITSAETSPLKTNTFPENIATISKPELYPSFTDLEDTIPVKPILKSDPTNESTIESEMAKLTDTKPEEGEIVPEQTYSTTSSKLLEILESKPDKVKLEKKLIPVTLPEGIPNFSGLTAAQKKTVTLQNKLIPPKTKFQIKSPVIKEPIKKSKAIVLSDQIITPANEPSKIISSKRNFEEDFEENLGGIKKFIIAKTEPSHTKPQILSQTILNPGKVDEEVKEIIDDNIFDINSMPIVLSDDLLTAESLESMPIVIEPEKPKTVPIVAKPKVEKMKILNQQKQIIHPALTKNQRVYQATSKMMPNKPAVITQPGKTEKFILLPSASGTPPPAGSKYTVGKRTIRSSPQTSIVVNKTIASTIVTSKPPTASSGNKVMVVTNSQGQQSRIILSPAQQKMLGNKFGTKLVARTSIPKPSTSQTISLNSVITSKGAIINPSPSPVKTQTFVTSKGLLTPVSGQSVISPKGQQLLAPRTFKSTPKKVQIQQQLLPVGQTMQGLKTKTMVIKSSHPKQIIQKQIIQPVTTSTTPVRTIVQKPQNRLSMIPKTNIVKRQVARPGQPQPQQRLLLQKLPLERKIEIKVKPQTPIKVNTTQGSHVPPLVPLSPKDPELQQTQPDEKAPKQLIIQDDMGNQTSITQGQILAVPGGEVVDGQPQSYMLVTVDESGNLLPLDNQALMALDPNLIGPDGNVTLQLNNSSPETQSPVMETPPEEIQSPAPKPEIQDYNQLLGDQNLDLLMSRDEPKTSSSDQAVTYSISNAEDGQQILISGDPEKAQHLINALASGTQDLSKLISSSEGGNIIINADGQHIILNSDATTNEQLILATSGDSFNYNPEFSNQSTTNQDILAAALANTVFPSEAVISEGLNIVTNSTGGPLMSTSELSPSLYQNMQLPNLPSGAVIETSLTNLAPIMSPLELPPGRLPKKVVELETNSQVPKSLELPITITDPNISQTVNDLQNNLVLPITITDPNISSAVPTSNFGYSLPNIDDTSTGPISMPLLTEDDSETKETKTDEIPEIDNSGNALDVLASVTTASGMLDNNSELEDIFAGKKEDELPAEVFAQNSFNEKDSNTNSDFTSRRFVMDSPHIELDTNSSEISIQPSIATEDETKLENNCHKRNFDDALGEGSGGKKSKFDIS